MTAVVTRMHQGPEPVPAVPPGPADAFRVRPDAERPATDQGPQGRPHAPAEPHPPGQAPAAGRGLPEPTIWAATLVRAVVETLKGHRPAAQLIRWVDADLWTTLDRRARLGAHGTGPDRRPAPVRVRRVHGCALGTGVWECSVVIDDGGRMRAVALRLEQLRGRWCATALQIG